VRLEQRPDLGQLGVVGAAGCQEKGRTFLAGQIQGAQEDLGRGCGTRGGGLMADGWALKVGSRLKPPKAGRKVAILTEPKVCADARGNCG